MFTHFPKRVGRVLTALPLALVLAVLPAASSSAASSKPLLPTKTIVTNSDKYINDIRTYFFCQTKTCKKVVKLNKALAKVAIVGIQSEIKLMKSDSVPATQRAIVAKYELDATALIKAFDTHPLQKGAVDASNNVGIIYYQTSNLGSDDYLLGCAQANSKVSFKVWSVGVVGVAYAMQVDTQAESSSAPASTVKSVNESLLVEANSMKSDANGPNKEFNSLIVQFANTQILDSRDSLLLLSGNKTVKVATLKALSKKLTSEFRVIAALQNKLAK